MARARDRRNVAVARQLERFRGRAIKTAPDGVLATFDGPARAVACAQAIRDAVAGLGLEVRAGVHIGEVDVRGEDTGGLTIQDRRAGRGLGANPARYSCREPSSTSSSDPESRQPIAANTCSTECPGRWQLFAVAG